MPDYLAVQKYVHSLCHLSMDGLEGTGAIHLPVQGSFLLGKQGFASRSVFRSLDTIVISLKLYLDFPAALRCIMDVHAAHFSTQPGASAYGSACKRKEKVTTVNISLILLLAPELFLLKVNVCLLKVSILLVCHSKEQHFKVQSHQAGFFCVSDREINGW